MTIKLWNFCFINLYVYKKYSINNITHTIISFHSGCHNSNSLYAISKQFSLSNWLYKIIFKIFVWCTCTMCSVRDLVLPLIVWSSSISSAGDGVLEGWGVSTAGAGDWPWESAVLANLTLKCVNNKLLCISYYSVLWANES